MCIEFDGDHGPRALQKFAREHADPRTDLHDRIALFDVRRLHDAVENRRIEQEVLTQIRIEPEAVG